MREIDFGSECERSKFVSNRLIRLDSLSKLDTSQPLVVPEHHEVICNDMGEQIATRSVPQVMWSASELYRLKTHAIFSTRQSLKELDQGDLADFILHPPDVKLIDLTGK